MNFKVLYRLSTNGYNKQKFSNATKLHCLENACEVFGEENVVVFIDKTNLVESVYDDAVKTVSDIRLYQPGSSAKSFREVFEYALSYYSDDYTVVYFLEDDYLHLDGSKQAIEEGLQRADYVTLYLHGDRFIPASKGGNPFIDDSASFLTRFCKSDNNFWISVESTTMTFASTIGQLKKDRSVWLKHTEGTHPNDFGIFRELTDVHERSLIAPVPTKATHCEPAWQSPLIGTNVSSWEQI